MINMYLKTKKTSLRWSLTEELLMAASNSYLTRNLNLKKLTLRKSFPSCGNLKSHLYYENHSMPSMLLNVFIHKWGWRCFVIFRSTEFEITFSQKLVLGNCNTSLTKYLVLTWSCGFSCPLSINRFFYFSHMDFPWRQQVFYLILHKIDVFFNNSSQNYIDSNLNFRKLNELVIRLFYHCQSLVTLYSLTKRSSN